MNLRETLVKYYNIDNKIGTECIPFDIYLKDFNLGESHFKLGTCDRIEQCIKVAEQIYPEINSKNFIAFKSGWWNARWIKFFDIK